VNTTAGTATDKTGVSTVTCTTGVPWVASASAGNGSGATFAVRKMTAGSSTLAYSLFLDAGRTSVWGNGLGGTSTISNVGTDSGQALIFYGRIFSNQVSVPAGNYSDLVVVTFTY
jgi:spore coat protein U-like protein